LTPAKKRLHKSWQENKTLDTSCMRPLGKKGKTKVRTHG